MGIYLNPGNDGFDEVLKSDYIDKTGMIAYINQRLGKKKKKLVCFSRPRRFGKTIAAQMLCAYYCKDCDSHGLFNGLNISQDLSYEDHLNKYDVIYLDLTWFISKVSDIKNVVSDIQYSVIEELREAYPNCIGENVVFLPEAILRVYKKTKRKFYFIIDEWDALMREAKDDIDVHEEYMELLRGLFKGPATPSSIIGAYMTGILPIKKYGTESALSEFEEYTMVDPLQLVEYIGFTEKEVRQLCEANNADYEKMEQWYDGYLFGGVQHVYSPNSVMSSLSDKKFGNYWTKTGTYESLEKYIIMNMDGLKDAVIMMLGGQRVQIDTLGFQNDLTNMHSRDDVLTLLVHLGYLAYDEVTKEVWIPNLEVADSFKLAVKKSDWNEVSEALEKSDELLNKTIAGNSDYVATALEVVHQNTTSILKYNDEDSLACVLLIAYYTARNDYNIIRELPSGKGYADFAFIPRRHSDKPAMIVELKYEKSATTALDQIKEKNYVGALKDFTGNMLLVGINYDKDKKHTCIIEKYAKQ